LPHVDHRFGVRCKVLAAQAGTNAYEILLGGFEIDLGDRARPGSRFTDIMFVGSDGRLLR